MIFTISRKTRFVIITLGVLAVAWLIYSYSFSQQLITAYNKQASLVVRDRYDKTIAVLPNSQGYTDEFITDEPVRLTELLLRKEDRFFYWHKGVNPISIMEAIIGKLGFINRSASSTITQQLTKVLLGNENKRTLVNKIKETIGAVALETHVGKKDILEMYINSIYFGNQIQGVKSASNFYFGKDPEMLSDSEALSLIATISNPNKNNPLKDGNYSEALQIAAKVGVGTPDSLLIDKEGIKKRALNFSFISDSYFELSPIQDDDCRSAIDLELTDKIRLIVQDNLEPLTAKNAGNAAVIVIKLPENEALVLIGSPNPSLNRPGYQINMLNEPRPIGSTIKPFIYLKAFEKGLRPYTIVDDREYKYITALGFPLYPKNFDYQYRGKVSLHYALSNSLNVPAVKVLEYVGLDDFYRFMENDLSFKPIQPISNYQLGIALGALEMPLMDLAHYFTIFPNNGVLKPLRMTVGCKIDDRAQADKTVAAPEYIRLINKILNDRKTGIEQFGINSELNLPQSNYALKTGTSRDFKDSWVIGYTPDFLVGVWVGNADNISTNEVSGQMGAGIFWMQTMELMINSQYNKNTPFNFSRLVEFKTPYGSDYGLSNDNPEAITNILENRDLSLIVNPHDGDNIIVDNNSVISLTASESVDWFINDIFFGNGDSIPYRPTTTGKYTIKATADDKEETITIFVERK